MNIENQTRDIKQKEMAFSRTKLYTIDRACILKTTYTSKQKNHMDGFLPKLTTSNCNLNQLFPKH